MFSLINVSVNYGTVAALAPTDLDVKPHRTVALIGPSGSGKSTLLRVMAGLARVKGEVRFDGRPVTDWRAVRLRLGYVIQDGGLFPHMTVNRNVTLMARELGWAEPRIAARLSELAGMTEMPADLLARYPAELSGGQRQRVGLMRALMLDPDVLLFDEPLSALDPITRIRLAQALKTIFAALDKTVVMVTHSLREARYLAGHVVLMRDGAIVQEGRLDSLETNPANDFVRDFVSAETAL